MEGARRTSPTYTPGDCGFQGCPLEVAKGQGVTFNTGDRERDIYIDCIELYFSVVHKLSSELDAYVGLSMHMHMYTTCTDI